VSDITVEKNGTIEAIGVVQRVLGNNNYVVEVPVADGKTISPLCHLSGKMRQFKISVIVGDTVKVVVPPPYDKGRITFREK
jgi:translation initiation factor IF-1